MNVLNTELHRKCRSSFHGIHLGCKRGARGHALHNNNFLVIRDLACDFLRNAQYHSIVFIVCIVIPVPS